MIHTTRTLLIYVGVSGGSSGSGSGGSGGSNGIKKRKFNFNRKVSCLYTFSSGGSY
jgi:hypothetical protein